MGKMKEFLMDCCTLWDEGLELEEIAVYLRADEGLVQDALEQWAGDMCTRPFPDVEDDDSYDEYMDGDAASALASAGWGTDEDYGYYGDE